MSLASFLVRYVFQFMLAALLLQFGDMPGDAPQENPFSRATTPPAQFLVFNDDFSSMDKTRFMQWIHPDRGFVKNGILLTRAEADAGFHAGGSNEAGVQAVNVFYNYGEFAGGNFFQADCWVEYKFIEGGEERWNRFHNMFVFEIIDSLWYLVQSEYVAPEADISISLQNVPQQDQPIATPYTHPALPGISPWPLLLGNNYTTGAELHPIQGKTWSGRTWSLAYAVSRKKPSVLYFFSVQSLAVATPEELKSQMDFLSDLRDTFGTTDLYIYGVTDEARTEVEWLGESGYTGFAVLLDEGSALHATMNIDVYPYIVVMDAEGTVVGISKTYRPSSWDLIRQKIRQAIAKAKA